MKTKDLLRVGVAALTGAVVGAALPSLAIGVFSAEVVAGMVFGAKEWLDVEHEKDEETEGE